MRVKSRYRVQLTLVLLLASQSLQCIGWPVVDERTVEVAFGTELSFAFESYGQSIDSGLGSSDLDQTASVVLPGSLDLDQLLRDAGIDPEDARELRVMGAAYRVTRPATCGCLRIENGNLTIQRDEVLPELPLISNFYADLSHATDLVTIPLQDQGVALLNDILSTVLEYIEDPSKMEPVTVTVHLDGWLVPSSLAADFAWEVVIILSGVAATEVKIVHT